MQLVIATFIVLAPMGYLIDFFITTKSNLRIKSALLNFYIKIEDGDWQLVVRGPAIFLSKCLDRLFSNKIMSITYIYRVAILSSIVTIAIYIISFSYTFYFMSYNQNQCPSPTFWLALQVPVYISRLVLISIIANFLMELVSWSIIHFLFRNVNKSNAIALLFVAFIVVLFVTHILYSISFPASVFLYIYDLSSLSRAFEDFIDLFKGEILQFHNILAGWSFPYRFDCMSRGYTMFSISNTTAIRVAIIGPMIPAVIYIFIVLISCVVYYTRFFTKKPLLLIIEALDRSPRVFTAVALLISSIVAIIRVAVG